MKKKSHARSPEKQGFSIALPKSLLAQVKAIAAAETRSRNGQIEHFLSESVSRWLKDQTRTDAPGIANPKILLESQRIMEKKKA